jgi:hypothetical protein
MRKVQAQRECGVEKRFVSLRLVNADVDDEVRFPPDYEAAHTCNLRLLRVAAAGRSEHGSELACSTRPSGGTWGSASHLTGVPDMRPVLVRSTLASIGLSVVLAEALDDVARNAGIKVETGEALSLTEGSWTPM